MSDMPYALDSNWATYVYSISSWIVLHSHAQDNESSRNPWTNERPQLTLTTQWDRHTSAELCCRRVCIKFRSIMHAFDFCFTTIQHSCSQQCDLSFYDAIFSMGDESRWQHRRIWTNIIIVDAHRQLVSDADLPLRKYLWVPSSSISWTVYTLWHLTDVWK